MVTGNATPYPDRLEVRLCTSGSCELPADGGVGDYEALLLSINPDLIPHGFPENWTQFVLRNADGLPSSGQGRLALRYHVTEGGPARQNSDYIGIDRVVYKVGSPAYALRGDLSGLGGGTLTLWLNGSELLPLSADGPFEFDLKLDPGAPYSISIYEQPAGQRCTIINASGIISAEDITDIQLSCAPR